MTTKVVWDVANGKDITVYSVVVKNDDVYSVEFSGKIDEFITWLFGGRCVTCKRVGVEISHIVPKGRGQEYKDDWRNLILQCRKCHDLHHGDGVTGDKIRELQDARRNFLFVLGRERFV